MNRIILIFAGIVFLCSSVLVSAQDWKGIIDGTLVKYEPGHEMAALVIGIHQEGKTQFFKFGSPEGKGKKLPTEHDLFEIGHATGVFTATLMMLESQKGSFLPEDRVIDHLPEGIRLPQFEKYNCIEVPLKRPIPNSHFSAIQSASICRMADGSPYCISFCDLASHTSGIRDMHHAFHFNPFRETAFPKIKLKYFSSEKVLKKINKTMLSFQPGEEYRYTTIDLAILGITLEHISGHVLGDLMEMNIFGPLGMNETTMNHPQTGKKGIIQGFSAENRPSAPLKLDAFQGAGGIRASASDLMVFLKAHFETDQVELKTAFEQCVAPRVDIPGKDGNIIGNMGYGWIISKVSEIDNRNIIWTAGATPGFQSFMGMNLENETAVIVLTADQSEAQKIGKDILQKLLKP